MNIILFNIKENRKWGADKFPFWIIANKWGQSKIKYYMLLFQYCRGGDDTQREAASGLPLESHGAANQV
ncbi:MAG: hypothetical protein COB35_03785 [Gammaproteobacteria bacterium]|nr:MAG: hypothetical protein COB35_03785 [Gammaproteobacteria bacterium]